MDEGENLRDRDQNIFESCRYCDSFIKTIMFWDVRQHIKSLTVTMISINYQACFCVARHGV